MRGGTGGDPDNTGAVFPHGETCPPNYRLVSEDGYLTCRVPGRDRDCDNSRDVLSRDRTAHLEVCTGAGGGFPH